MSGSATFFLDGDRLRVSGDLSLDSVADLWARSRALFETGTPPRLVDVSAVTRADSAGIALVVEWFAMARARGTDLRIEGVSPTMGDIIRLADLQELLSGVSDS
ncbi:STAS domain-containing protein [Thioalkalivibrio sulfidiphilus]|uniref:STAS domain-containing protein n=1 Tax=Thioalkalivibrio sulfidiphilus TaxID=1033854 RepID=UPI003B35D103